MARNIDEILVQFGYHVHELHGYDAEGPTLSQQQVKAEVLTDLLEMAVELRGESTPEGTRVVDAVPVEAIRKYFGGEE